MRSSSKLMFFLVSTLFQSAKLEPPRPLPFVYELLVMMQRHHDFFGQHLEPFLRQPNDSSQFSCNPFTDLHIRCILCATSPLSHWAALFIQLYLFRRNMRRDRFSAQLFVTQQFRPVFFSQQLILKTVFLFFESGQLSTYIGQSVHSDALDLQAIKFLMVCLLRTMKKLCFGSLFCDCGVIWCLVFVLFWFLVFADCKLVQAGCILVIFFAESEQLIQEIGIECFGGVLLM